jgi:hypothetical protein
MKKIISTIVLLFTIQYFVNAQSWSLYGFNSCFGTEKFGGDISSSSPLEIHMDGPYSIEFYTNNIAGTPPTLIKHMELTSDGDLSLWNWGTGSTKKNAYEIGGDKVLWHNGDSRNIYVGVGAGASKTSGIANTFMGYHAGYLDINNDSNTFIGSHTGASLNSVRSYGHTFIGSYAGAAFNQPNVYGNTYVGYSAGRYDTAGTENTLIGYNTCTANNNITNATAIGANARVNIDNGFVLGNNKTNVGIRTTTPQYALEVRGTLAAEKIIILKQDNTTENLIAIIEQQQTQIALLTKRLDEMEKLTAKN